MGISPGTRLGGYVLGERIGRGGMGVVYRARHVHLERDVALKFLAPELTDDEDFRERFLRESRLAASLDHPNVVTVYDAGEFEGTLYIAMRYVEGTDLEKFLREQRRLAPAMALAMLDQVGAALDAAHRVRLIHRDVKPANVLLDSGRCYLTDFGLTKRVGATDAPAALTRTGRFVGTVHYVAPEQIEGRELDGRIDIYALTGVLHECLTGVPPFPRDSELAIMYAHMRERPPRPSELRPELPSAIDDVVATGMAKSPSERYSTCFDLLAAACEAFGEAAPAGAKPPLRAPATAGSIQADRRRAVTVESRHRVADDARTATESRASAGRGSRGGLGFRPGGPVAATGQPQPPPTYESSREPASEHRVSLPPPLMVAVSGPLVDRGAELEELERLWRDVRGGRRAVAVIVGEPGIGKTRLAAELCRRAYGEGAEVLLGRCYERSIIPYQSFVEALRHYASETPLDELRLQVGRHRPVLARLVPELADQVPGSSATGGSPEREQFQLFDSVASLLHGIAEKHPLVLVLDDLHWADAPTLLLLRHVVRVTEDSSLLILGTYRQTEVDEAHPLEEVIAELRRGRTLATVALGGLDESGVVELVASQLRGAPAATVARSIVERTQGNPFFVEELLRDVGPDGDVGDALTRIPDSVKDLLLRRLRRLDEGCRRLLSIAAVTGHEFGLDVLELVAGGPAEEIAEGLEPAIAAQVIHESPTALGQYTFAHALIRETIYDQISLTRRAQLHRRIGEAIERALGDAARQRAGSLAYHFSAAGDVRKGYEYHSQAAAAAALVYAVEPALAHYTAALEAGAKLGLDPTHEPALRRLLLQRGKMRYRTGDVTGAQQDFEAVLAAAQQAGDRVGELETLNELGINSLGSDLRAASASHEAALEIARELGDTAAETSALDRLSVVSSHLLRFDRAVELGERALELARGIGDEIVIGRAIDSLKLAAWQLGDLRRLEALTAELELLWRERGDLWYLQWTLLESAFVPLGRARWEDAQERLAAASAINRRVHDPLAEMLILDASGWLSRSRGAYQDALDAGRQAVALAADVGWEGWAAATLGSTLLDLRAPGPAALVLERGVAAAERIGAVGESARCLAQLAWARCLLGDQDEASALCARARELLEGVSAPDGGAFVFGAHAYAAMARVLLAGGHPEQGDELLLGVFRAAERFGWHEAAACTELMLGLCSEACGELESARQLLGHAAGLADKYGIPGVGWETHAALARLVDEPDEHRAAADAILERVAVDLTDDDLRDGLRQWAMP